MSRLVSRFPCNSTQMTLIDSRLPEPWDAWPRPPELGSTTTRATRAIAPAVNSRWGRGIRTRLPSPSGLPTRVLLRLRQTQKAAGGCSGRQPAKSVPPFLARDQRGCERLSRLLDAEDEDRPGAGLGAVVHDPPAVGVRRAVRRQVRSAPGDRERRVELSLVAAAGSLRASA